MTSMGSDVGFGDKLKSVNQKVTYIKIIYQTAYVMRHVTITTKQKSEKNGGTEKKTKKIIT